MQCETFARCFMNIIQEAVMEVGGALFRVTCLHSVKKCDAQMVTSRVIS